MIEILRATSVSVVNYLEPHLIPDVDVPLNVYKEHIRQALLQHPESVFILVGINEHERIVGFLISYAPDNVKYVFVSQAWCDNAVIDTNLSDKFYLRLLRWADMIGRESIRAETYQDPKGFTRKWGFKPISTTLEVKLEDVDTDAIKKLVRKDTEHVEEVRTESNVDPNGGTEAGQSNDRRLSESEDRTGIDSVHGSASGPNEQPVQLDTTATAELESGVDAESTKSESGSERPSCVAAEPRPDSDS